MRLPLAALSLCALACAVPAAAQTPAPPVPAPAAAPAPKGVIAEARAAIAEGDFAKGERIVGASLSADGATPEAIEALSWLGRGALAARRYDEARRYALRAYAMVEEQLQTRKLDDETHLPLALGASIEVQAQAMAAGGDRSEAVLFLRRELEAYQHTSIAIRTQKNINLLSLEGQPAFALTSTEWLGPAPPALADLAGRPVIVYLWAHWCPDCKIQGPILETLLNKYKNQGLTLVAPTQFWGYVARRQAAAAAEERVYLTRIRDEVYPWMKDYAVPISEDIFAQYGVSTTPTLVLIDRAGRVSTFNPGRMTIEALDEALQLILAPTSS